MKNTDSATAFPRLESLILLIRYLYTFPHSTIEDICRGCRISEATFYRFKHSALALGVKIVFMKEKNGFAIVNYGLINERKLS
jgi:predicted DNA-binding transcriptional regulator YafY